MENYLLTNKNTRAFNVDLAKVIGLNEAIALQQIQYWIEIKETDLKKYNDSIHEGFVWVYNSITKWQKQFPFWSYDTVKRAFKSLENQGVIISKMYNKKRGDKTKWYRIDYDRLNEIMSANLENTDECKLPLSNSADCTNGIEQIAPTNTKDYTENTSKTSIESVKLFSSTENDAFSEEILTKQIIKCFKMNGHDDAKSEIVKEGVKIIQYYYAMYKNTFGYEHPRINNRAMCGVVQRYLYGSTMTEGQGDFDMYSCLIDKYFLTDFKQSDCNICHFMTEEVRNNLYYETCY